MVRIKSSVQSKKSKKKVLKKAKGYAGARSKRLRAAKEQVMHAGADSFTHRKDKKSDYRKLWISRINACQSTVPDLSSEINKSANLVNFDSVYLIAANDLGSSCEPQLP